MVFIKFNDKNKKIQKGGWGSNPKEQKYCKDTVTGQKVYCDTKEDPHIALSRQARSNGVPTKIASDKSHMRSLLDWGQRG
jgi:hypothetical protein